jgi:hypothetical protein
MLYPAFLWINLGKFPLRNPHNVLLPVKKHRPRTRRALIQRQNVLQSVILTRSGVIEQGACLIASKMKRLKGENEANWRTL